MSEFNLAIDFFIFLHNLLIINILSHDNQKVYCVPIPGCFAFK